MPLFALAVLSADFATGATLPDSPKAPGHLRCEGLVGPLGIEATRPRLSWQVSDPRINAVQSAYQIQTAGTPEQLARGEFIWDSKEVKSAQSIEVGYEGPGLKTGQSVSWRVRTWDAAGTPSPWSETAHWEMGLLDAADWKAQWIGHPPRFTGPSVPVVHLRKEFAQKAPVRRARLYLSARGLFEATINGARIGNDHFTPGWTDYAKRNQYLTYDVTSAVQAGANVIGILLADGWHNGRLKWDGLKKNWYGRDTSVIAQLVCEDATGRISTVVTDDSWRVATGPITQSDLYNGEKYDARLEIDGWEKPGFDDAAWIAPRIEKETTGPLVAKINEPVRRREELRPASVTRAPDGEWVFDLGQNMVGWARLRLSGRAGQTVTLRFAEMLNRDGTLYVENLRSAEATDTYTFRGDGEVEWEPRFTFHGFRYVGLSGIAGEPGLAAITGVVLHSDAPPTGDFACSNELLNQLQSNIRWGQKGNFFEVPTDCPQRDERLGWTGDAQVFIPTATFNMEVSPFFEKWMTDMRDSQQPNGEFPFYAPALDETKSSTAWGDAGVICPWVIYQRYGNEKILADNFEAMRRWVDFEEKSSTELIRPDKGFGDWLAIDAPKPGEAPTPRPLIGTAYFAHTSSLVSHAAGVLGKDKEARHYADLAERVRAAFNREFVQADGRLIKETQTGYLLALGFDLLPEKHRAAALAALLADLESRQWHLSTGFVGTGLLMPVLSKAGRNDVAYRILLQETYPGWLYSIRQGATTMWERWNSYTHEDGFGPVSMNSFNHYAYGAVGEWMYSVIAGIDAAEPGFRKIRIRPQPGGGVFWARGSLETPYGRVSTDWKLEGENFTLLTKIPANTTAIVELPDGTTRDVGAGTHALTVKLAP